MTDIQTTRFVRKPLHVNAIRVTHENMEAVAEWCGGVMGKQGHRQFIRLYLKYARTPRQTVAYSGDWITRVGTTFKVWTNKSFRETFDPETNQGARAQQVIVDETTLSLLLP